MDINDIRVAVTVTGLILFLALTWHAWHRRRKPDHEAAARLVFDGEVESTPGERPGAAGK